MSESSKAQKEKALKKLVRTWRAAKDMQSKADLLLAKNPGLNSRPATGKKARP